MSAAAWIAALWLGFVLTHMVPSSRRWRARLVARLGQGAFLGLYSLVALALFVPLVWIYMVNRHQGPLLWDLRALPGLRTAALVLAGFGFALFVAAFFQPSPATVGMRGAVSPRGLHLITRHPMFMGTAIIGLAHLLLEGFLTDVLFFGGLLLYSVVGCLHQDARKRATEGERFAQFYRETSFLPFVALLAGRTRLPLYQLPWLPLLVGAVAAGVFYRLHWVMFF
jgi:uncharacterized membrane protein